jgi:predicted amidophosphoribosyltransferase
VLIIGFVCGQIMASSIKSVHFIEIDSKVSMLCLNLAFSISMLCLRCLADLHALPNCYHTLVHEQCCSSKRQMEV